MAKSYKDDGRCGNCMEHFEITEKPIREGYGMVTLRCLKCGTVYTLGPMDYELPKKERKKRARST